MENHVSEEEFILEFCGNFGREFGCPDQFFVDNPKSIFQFIKDCEEQKKPAFLSVQPRKAHHVVLGFEKIFYDFDYADKTFLKKLAQEESDEAKREEIIRIRKEEMPREVMRFVNGLVNMNLYPLVIKTRKGYHVYLYFDSVYEINNEEIFWKEVYKYLYDYYLKLCGGNFKYADTTSKEDIYRMSRIPLSIHEKSGEKCIVVDYNLKPTKIRGLGNYKNHCLRGSDLKKAVEKTRNYLMIKARLKKIKEKFEEKHPKKFKNYKSDGQLRPCFLKALQDGEMPHKMRLALLLEAWYKGVQTRQGLIDVFRPLHDFDGDNIGQSNCRDQIDWFLQKRKYEKYKPYACSTMIKENWCIQSVCSHYNNVKKRK